MYVLIGTVKGVYLVSGVCAGVVVGRYFKSDSCFSGAVLCTNLSKKLSTFQLTGNTSLTIILIWCLLRLSKFKVLYVSPTAAMFHKSAKHKYHWLIQGSWSSKQTWNFFSAAFVVEGNDDQVILKQKYMCLKTCKNLFLLYLYINFSL